VASGQVFGSDQPIILHLLDIAFMEGVLNGVVMEVNDCAYPLVKEIVATVDEKTAFTGVDAAFLVGSMPRREGMERKDLLAANVKVSLF
jgi:malate dehydrogenase